MGGEVGGYIWGNECNTVTTSVNTGDFERRECNMLQYLSVTKLKNWTQRSGARIPRLLDERIEGGDGGTFLKTRHNRHTSPGDSVLPSDFDSSNRHKFVG